MDILLVVILGTLCGFFCSLIPGLHVNLVSVVFLSFVPYFMLPHAVLFLLALSCAMTVSEGIVSTYLGAVGTQVISHLPAHELVREGYGPRAIGVWVSASCVGCIMCASVVWLCVWTMTFLAQLTNGLVGYLVLGVLLFIFARESKFMAALCLFITSGIAGALLLGSSLAQPLVILFGGLFGLPSLVQGLAAGEVPTQKQSDVPLLVGAVSIGTVLSFIATFLPGLGASQLSMLAMHKNISREAVIAYNASMNTTNVLFSFGAMLALDNARSGAIAVLMQFAQVDVSALFTCAVVCVASASLSGVLTVLLGSVVARSLPYLPLRIIRLSVSLFLCGLVYYFDGGFGLFCLATCFSVGYLGSLLDVPRQYFMGCLLIPVLFFFLT